VLVPLVPPVPSSPKLLSPQHHRVRPVRVAQVAMLPADTVAQLVPVPTWTGVLALAVAAGAELARGVVSPAPQGAAGPGGAGAELASGHGGPVGGRADLYGSASAGAGLAYAELAEDVVSPAHRVCRCGVAQVATSPAETVAQLVSVPTWTGVLVPLVAAGCRAGRSRCLPAPQGVVGADGASCGSSPMPSSATETGKNRGE